MTLFKRTELSLEDLEKLLVSLEGHSADFADKKRRLNELTEMADTLSQNCSKLRKAANEPDPAKRTYGEQMSRKVIEVCDRFDALQPKVSTVAEAVSAECREWEAEMAVKLEQEAKASAAAAAASSAAAKAEEKQKTEEKASTTPSAAAGAVTPASPKAASVVPQTVAASTQPQVMDKASTKPQEAPTPAAAKENQAVNKASATPPAASANEKQDKDKTASTPPAATSACAVTLNLKSNVAGEGTTSVTVASLDTSVMQLKEAIAAKMGHAADSQRLIFTGRVLDNSQPLSAYNIKSNCTLHLVVSKSLGAAKSPTKEGGGLGPPAGLVHGITGGAIELRQVLINAGPRLVVVDWMAPWCGPCRAIAPKIDDLASNNADVVFLKIDTEASGENKALAMDAQIQAFPTFHFYINSNRVAQVVSADLNKIVTTMNQHKPNIVSEAAAALGEADPAAADALVQKVKAALVKLKASCSSDQDFIAATKTFLSFIGNCVNNPTEAKYRRIRQGNPSFQSRLGSKVGGIEALKAFGFNEVSEGVPPEDYLILDSVLPEMVQVKELLEKAVPGGSAAAAAPASSLSSLSPAGGLGGLGGLPGMMGAMGAGGMGGLGGVGGPGGMANIENAMRMMENPAIRQMTENLMRNPRMMQVMHEAMQSGNPHSMMSNPEFQASLQEMMQDPAMMQAMSNPETMVQMQQAMMGMRGGGGLGGAMPPFMGGMGGFSPFMGGMPGGMPPVRPTTPATTTPSTPSGGGAAPAAPAPASSGDGDEEEEAMLAEALRLSMDTQPRDQAPP